MSWLAQDTPGGVHVIPLGDDLPHEESESCACQPRVALVDGPSRVVCRDVGEVHTHELVQYVRKLVTHAAWDGRPE